MPYCDDSCKFCNRFLAVSNHNYYRCDNCGPGQFLNTDGYTCSPCIPHCTTCSDATTCTQCNTGFIFDRQNTVSCLEISCFPTCNKCNPDDTKAVLVGAVPYYPCADCPTAYYVNTANNSKCEKCIPNCDSCTDAKSCTTCRDGYVAIGNQCVLKKCPFNCGSCDETTTAANLPAQYVCTACKDGSYLVTAANAIGSATIGTCSTCISHCKQCQDGASCSACSDGYTFDSTNTKCVPIVCPGDCKTCDRTVKIPYDSGKEYYGCIDCLPSNYLEPTNKICYSCIANCAQCTGKYTCDQCKTGYTYDTTAQRCVQIPCSSTCKSCDRSTELIATSGRKYYGCTDCPDGFFKNAQNGNRCDPCLPNCATCSLGTTCTSCSPGYAAVGGANGVCVLAIASSTCSIADTTASPMVLGSTPYYNCKTCPDRTYQDNTLVSECHPCPSYCDACSQGDKCDTCSVGYTKDSTGKCLQNICSPSCNNCDLTSPVTFITGLPHYECAKCPSRMYPKDHFTCNSCMSYCESCKDSTTCDACISGYQYVSGECIAITTLQSKITHTQKQKIIGGILGAVFGLAVIFALICLVKVFKGSGKRHSKAINKSKKPKDVQQVESPKISDYPESASAHAKEGPESP